MRRWNIEPSKQDSTPKKKDSLLERALQQKIEDVTQRIRAIITAMTEELRWQDELIEVARMQYGEAAEINQNAQKAKIPLSEAELEVIREMLNESAGKLACAVGTHPDVRPLLEPLLEQRRSARRALRAVSNQLKTFPWQ